MNETVTLAAAGLAGVLLGGFFFGGLWLTVRKGVSAQRPALLFLASLLLRVVGTVAGFAVIGGGHWQRLLVCLLGFVIARFLITGFAAPPAVHCEAPAKGSGHAP